MQTSLGRDVQPNQGQRVTPATGLCQLLGEASPPSPIHSVNCSKRRASGSGVNSQSKHWVKPKPDFQQYQQVLDYASYDSHCRTVITMDASSHNLGAALLRNSQDDLKQVTYYSQTLGEKQQSQIDKEHLVTCRDLLAGLHKVWAERHQDVRDC